MGEICRNDQLISFKDSAAAAETDLLCREGHPFAIRRFSVYIDIVVLPFFQAVGVQMKINAVDLLRVGTDNRKKQDESEQIIFQWYFFIHTEIMMPKIKDTQCLTYMPNNIESVFFPFLLVKTPTNENSPDWRSFIGCHKMIFFRKPYCRRSLHIFRAMYLLPKAGEAGFPFRYSHDFRKAGLHTSLFRHAL
jgi:hypothetical protein